MKTFSQMLLAYRRQRPISIRRHFSSDGYFSRRDLSPLIKAIHPDMFGQDSSAIQEANLKCLQSLNEMCDSIESLQSVSHSIIEVAKPLKTQYILNCFMRVKRDESAMGLGDSLKGNVTKEEAIETQSVSVTLRTPNTLCARHRIPEAVLIKSLQLLLHQLTPLFEKANLECPYERATVRPKTKAAASKESSFFLEDKNIVDLAELQKVVDIQTVEARLIQKDRLIRSSVFKDRSQKVDRKFHWELMNDEIETYFRAGNVLVKGLLKPEEILAVQTLKQFFHDYGALINFSSKQWRFVIIVLFDRSTLPKVKYTEEEILKRKSMSSGMKKALDVSGFKCFTEGSTYLVEVPHNFRNPAMLEFLRLKLPLTALTAGYA